MKQNLLTLEKAPTFEKAPEAKTPATGKGSFFVKSDKPEADKPEHYTLFGVSKDLFRRPIHLPRSGRQVVRIRQRQYGRAVNKLHTDLRELGSRRTVPGSMVEAVLQCTGPGSTVRWQLARLRAEDQCSRRAMLREQC